MATHIIELEQAPYLNAYDTFRSPLPSMPYIDAAFSQADGMFALPLPV